MDMRNNYALIIGVKDYSTYDRAASLAPAAHQVSGALNDARAHYGYCLTMGFAPERIRVLTSPALSAAEMDASIELASKSTYGEATRARMLEGIAWLSQQIDGPAPSSGLLTFSGHGDEDAGGRGPLLCPSDVTPSLEEVIDLPALLAKAPAVFRDNLTVLLDCCSSAVGPSAGASLRASVRASGKGVPWPGLQRTRILAACQQDQQSVSSHFVGQPMGAFTWAVTSVIGQWQTKVEDGVVRLDLSYVELLERTRSLLSVLGFAQVPSFSGSEEVAKLPFLHPGEKLQAGETSAAPDAPRANRQLPGGCVADGSVKYREYKFELGSPPQTLAKVLVTCSSVNQTSSETVYKEKEEYWFIDLDVAENLISPAVNTTLTITFTKEDTSKDPSYTPPSGMKLHERTPKPPDWKRNGNASQLFYTTKNDQNIGIKFILNQDNNGKVTSIQSIYWLNKNNGNFYFDDSDQPPKSVPLSYTTTSINGNYYDDTSLKTST